jgi:hypothetical protein
VAALSVDAVPVPTVAAEPPIRVDDVPIGFGVDGIDPDAETLEPHVMHDQVDERQVVA